MKEEGLQFSISAVTARLTVEEVSLYVIDGKGWNIIFDTEPTRVSVCAAMTYTLLTLCHVSVITRSLKKIFIYLRNYKWISQSVLTTPQGFQFAIFRFCWINQLNDQILSSWE